MNSLNHTLLIRFYNNQYSYHAHTHTHTHTSTCNIVLFNITVLRRYISLSVCSECTLRRHSRIYLLTLRITASGYTAVTVAHNLFIRSRCIMRYGTRVIYYNKQSRLSRLAVNTVRVWPPCCRRTPARLHVTKHKSRSLQRCDIVRAS